MRVAVIGSRKLDLEDISAYLPPEITVLISGGARGVDTAAEKYADARNLPKLILRPDYEKYGKRAPLMRNMLIVQLSDLVIAIWDGKSRGTKYAIEYAKKMDIPVIIYLV